MPHWNGTLFNWEVIDEFIEKNDLDLGDSFTAAEVRNWMYQEDYSGFNASVCIASHRARPSLRQYTLERIGWGPTASQRIVQTPWASNPKAITSRSERQFSEAIAHWKKERLFGMVPLAARSRRARQILDQAEARFHETFSVIREEVDLELRELNGHH